MACPGDASRRNARGSNRLIAEGACVVQTPEDILESMRTDIRFQMIDMDIDGSVDKMKEEAPDEEDEGRPLSNPLENCVRVILVDQSLPIDSIMDHCGKNGYEQSAVLESLLKMELEGYIQQMPGRVYSWHRTA